jgi:rRNA maturation endonuclease Nob1
MMRRTMGHVLYCTGCGENYWSAMERIQPGDPCRQCGEELALDRRDDVDEAPSSADRRTRPPVHAEQ